MTALIPKDYTVLLNDIKQRIRSAQYEALKAVNKELISLYWDIGRMIVERRKEETWGKSVVERLARDLQAEFPGIGGFSASNLWRIKLFHETYAHNPKLAPLVREIGWSHNIIIMERCRDDYTFDFLELGEEHSERQLEQAILAKVEKFLREMGGMFAFIGSQYRLEVGGEEYFIDLLLYHRVLKCLVAIELKIGKFIPEYIGKMQFYLAVLDDKVRMDDEKPSIGIILCKSKDKTIVEYALRESNKPIGVAVYRMVTTLPKELRGQLPGPEQIEKLLEGVE